MLPDSMDQDGLVGQCSIIQARGQHKWDGKPHGLRCAFKEHCRTLLVNDKPDFTTKVIAEQDGIQVLSTIANSCCVQLKHPQWGHVMFSSWGGATGHGIKVGV